MVDSVGGTSLAHRARESILHSILERRFEDSRLPPENELADMLGVSRTTVRSALQSLEQHGVLTRSPRRGTQVHGRLSPSMVALQRLIGFTRLLEASGKPAIWAINYIQADLFSERPADDQLAQSPFDMGDLLVGGPVDHALVELVPCKATNAVVKRLGLKPSEPYILLKELHLSESGAVLGFSL